MTTTIPEIYAKVRQTNRRTSKTDYLDIELRQVGKDYLCHTIPYIAPEWGFQVAKAINAYGKTQKPCECDPPGSGEEHCKGHCFLKAEIKTLKILVVKMSLALDKAHGWLDEHDNCEVCDLIGEADKAAEGLPEESIESL